MTETTRHRVAASVVVRGRGGKILLVREADPRVRGALNLPGGHVEGFADSMTSHFREVYRAVLAGAAPADPLYATFEAGHHEMTVGDAVAQSAAQDHWVDVED